MLSENIVDVQGVLLQGYCQVNINTVIICYSLTLTLNIATDGSDRVVSSSNFNSNPSAEYSFGYHFKFACTCQWTCWMWYVSS